MDGWILHSHGAANTTIWIGLQTINLTLPLLGAYPMHHSWFNVTVTLQSWNFDLNYKFNFKSEIQRPHWESNNGSTPWRGTVIGLMWPVIPHASFTIHQTLLKITFIHSGLPFLVLILPSITTCPLCKLRLQGREPVIVFFFIVVYITADKQTHKTTLRWWRYATHSNCLL